MQNFPSLDRDLEIIKFHFLLVIRIITYRLYSFFTGTNLLFDIVPYYSPVEYNRYYNYIQSIVVPKFTNNQGNQVFYFLLTKGGHGSLNADFQQCFDADLTSSSTNSN